MAILYRDKIDCKYIYEDSGYGHRTEIVDTKNLFKIPIWPNNIVSLANDNLILFYSLRDFYFKSEKDILLFKIKYGL